MSKVIDAQGISKYFGDKAAVNQLDLQVHAGQIYGFLGPNGSGKTTAIRMLTGLLTPTEGKVSVLHYSLPKQAEQLRQQFGYMTQKFSLYDDLTVLENLRFVGQIYNLPTKLAQQRISALLTNYNLSALVQQLAGSLSGGQKQRVALACATIHQPKILFLDEPTSAVDPENRRDFWEKLFDLADTGTAILVSTHYMDEAERCHKVAVLNNGVKSADGSPNDLIENLPQHTVEITSQAPRKIKALLENQPDILSVSQLGQTLRVSLPKSNTHPIDYINHFTAAVDHVHCALTRASLEDVFVYATGKKASHS